MWVFQRAGIKLIIKKSTTLRYLNQKQLCIVTSSSQDGTKRSRFPASVVRLSLGLHRRARDHSLVCLFIS